MSKPRTVIREYRASDLAACRALWAELVDHHREIYSDPGIGGDDPGRHIEPYLSNAHLRGPWVADISGTIVGLAGLIVEEEEAEVEPVVVSSEWRSHGIGNMLLGHVVEEARKCGVRFLNVRPVARNTKAFAFFVEAGFDLVGHIELFQELTEKSGREWNSGISLHVQELRF